MTATLNLREAFTKFSEKYKPLAGKEISVIELDGKLAVNPKDSIVMAIEEAAKDSDIHITRFLMPKESGTPDPMAKRLNIRISEKTPGRYYLGSACLG